MTASSLHSTMDEDLARVFQNSRPPSGPFLLQSLIFQACPSAFRGINMTSHIPIMHCGICFGFEGGFELTEVYDSSTYMKVKLKKSAARETEDTRHDDAGECMFVLLTAESVWEEIP